MFLGGFSTQKHILKTEFGRALMQVKICRPAKGRAGQPYAHANKGMHGGGLILR
jgi:hypothetical protein